MTAARTLSGAVLAALSGLLIAASTVVLPTTAHAAACSGTTGVTVVVDYNELGGGLQQACDADGGGKSASTVFTDSGFELDYATRQPGFVCRVENVPASAPCKNTSPGNAFWSLWVSNGSGGWTFASSGATTLTVPEGGAVAFSWENTESGDSPPDASSNRPTPSSSPSSSPSQQPTRGSGNGGGDGTANGGGQSGGTAGAGGGAGSASGDAPSADGSTPSASPSGSPRTGRPGTKRERRARAERTGTKDRQGRSGKSAEPSPDDSEPDDAATPSVDDPAPPAAAEPAAADGLPGWVAPGLIGVLFAVAAGVLFLRRRSSTP